LRLEAQELSGQILSDRRVLNRLQHIPHSGAASRRAQELRERYQQAIERRCELLDTLLQAAEVREGELQEENHALRQSLKQLSYKLNCARYELKKALGLKASTEETKPELVDRPAQASKENKVHSPGKRGAPKGHRGCSRPIPKKIDFTEVITPPLSCECGSHSIEPIDVFDSKYIEDIPPVSKIVTHYKYQRGRCTRCGKVARHTQAVNGPPVIVGPNLAVHLTLMNQMGTSFRKLSVFSTRVLGTQLSASGVLGLVKRVGSSLEGSYENLCEALGQQSVLNADETGWKVRGHSGYIWCFCNKYIAFFHHDHSRAATVIEEILGPDFKGIVTCDFYAAYNCIEKTQRCLIHLLREIKKEREVLSSSKLLERFESKVKEFIEKGLQVQAMDDGPQKEQAVDKLEKQLARLSTMPVTKGKAIILQKRINKYHDHLIRFVTHPDVEFHNNRAERQVRPMVIARKVSFGSDTERGALRHCIINSIVETCKLQNRDPIDFMRRAYTSGGLDVPDICSPPAA
jgi:hypothetical protein